MKSFSDWPTFPQVSIDLILCAFMLPKGMHNAGDFFLIMLPDNRSMSRASLLEVLISSRKWLPLESSKALFLPKRT